MNMNGEQVKFEEANHGKVPAWKTAEKLQKKSVRITGGLISSETGAFLIKLYSDRITLY
jgi:hypothetical protein